MTAAQESQPPKEEKGLLSKQSRMQEKCNTEEKNTHGVGRRV
jgi:hypothetical protein